VAEAESRRLIDASVIVRYLTGDPPELASHARRVIDGDDTLLLTAVCLLETWFVLTKYYRIPRAAAVEALASLVQKRNLHLVSLPKPLVLEALSLCVGSARYSLADTLLWAEARNLPRSRVLTFDRRFPADGVEVELIGDSSAFAR